MVTRRMPIIDAHTHVGFGKAIRQRAKGLVAQLDRAHVDKAMVFAGAINDCTNEALLGEIAPYKGRLYGVGSVSPDGPKAYRPSVPSMDAWLKRGDLRAIKFYLGYESFYPSDSRLRPYLRLLQKHGRPAIFHSGDTYNVVRGAKLKYAHALHVDDLAAEMPDLKIIIAHLGSPWIIDAAQVCYKNENVYADCSGFVYGDFSPKKRAEFMEVWKEFERVSESNGRILFGSDWPISDIQGYVEVVRALAGHHAKEVFHQNAQALFGLKP